MKIDWQTRIKSKKFWLTLIPAVLLLIQTILVPFGYKWDFGILNQQLTSIINAVFGVLTIIGVVSDQNIKGDE
ncbi:phage holin [Enterococcus cecorum]|uniref:phage holin n=1 Tax=Enterococcus cecorum TaxID=44008 RepID=UPI00200B6204|nr:phage holin [Enterococcus cecorum]